MEGLEEEPLALDLKFNGVQLISNIQVEGLGVYSYRGYLNYQSPLSLDTSKILQESSFIPFKGLMGGDDNKGDALVQKIGLIVNVSLQGN